jgi:hypothetical protein
VSVQANRSGVTSALFRGDGFDAGDRPPGKVVEQVVPVERLVEGEIEAMLAIGLVCQ